MKHLDPAGYGRPRRAFGYDLGQSDAVAEWILAGTDDAEAAWTVGSIVPRGFESYLRIPHLAQVYDPAEGRNPDVSYLTWAQVARWKARGSNRPRDSKISLSGNRIPVCRTQARAIWTAGSARC
jgi:hypothetical protein